MQGLCARIYQFEVSLDNKLRIRPAVGRDVQSVRICAEGAYEQYVDAIGKAPAPMVADFEALIAAEHVHVAVNPDNEVLGFVVFYPTDQHVLLENVAVKASASGQGIGKALIAFCEASARKLGARSIKLYTNEKMTENLSIYPHLGYKETGRVTEDGFERVYFEKVI